MKHFSFLVLTLLSFQIASAQKIKIKLYNNTGYDLDSVMIVDKFVGKRAENKFVPSNFAS